jgi:hypothetical protein
MKIKCSKCKSTAIWNYSPGKDCDDNYFCDGCVPRGCSCNLNEDGEEEYLDDLGRQLPCCEYDFSEEGFVDEKYPDFGFGEDDY